MSKSHASAWGDGQDTPCRRTPVAAAAWPPWKGSLACWTLGARHISACDSLSETDWTLMRHNVTLPIRDDVVDAQGVRLLLLACFLPGM